MLESDWLTNVQRCAIIFRETSGSFSQVFLECFTVTYHLARFNYLKKFFTADHSKRTKTHNNTDQANTYK